MIVDWINETGEKIVDLILKPFYTMPGFLKLLIVIVLAFLSIVGLIRVARRALKTVVGVACAFIVIMILWLIISKL